MGQTTYIPKPINLNKVQLPDELNELVEIMAKNVHEVWAKSRIEQGWTYGPVRNDEKLHHPCLVPYEELPETEKDYDRNTAIETLKFIMNVGFEIRRK
ncbi:MAG: RyR domain-containing protein [Muribaculaceae bacterium]